MRDVERIWELLARLEHFALAQPQGVGVEPNHGPLSQFVSPRYAEISAHNWSCHGADRPHKYGRRDREVQRPGPGRYSRALSTPGFNTPDGADLRWS